MLGAQVSKASGVQQVSILGATGSIGLSTLKVLSQHPQHYRVFALSGFHRLAELAQLCCQYQPEIVVVPDGQTNAFLLHFEHYKTPACSTPEILEGEAGLCEIASHIEVDVVMAAIVGAAGLLPTLAAAEAGKRVLLANKESLVMAGDVLMQTIKTSGSILLPIDSEHNAIFQCLPLGFTPTSTGQTLTQMGVSRILLTASGGPFRTWSTEQIAVATPAQACNHPNWQMGQKISVDSATLMNKGLELIEACYLFGLEEAQIQVVIHPESIIHSMVQYVDGSTLAQMGNPDMCTPIAHALAWPSRISTHVPPLDLIAQQQLHFSSPDTQKFPCLAYAREAMRQGGTMPAIMNAANEVAVAAFLAAQLSFNQISQLINSVMTQIKPVVCSDLKTILYYDGEARAIAHDWLSSHIKAT